MDCLLQRVVAYRCALFREELCIKERLFEEEQRRREAQSMLENAAWLEIERVAQEEFRRKRQVEEQRKKERDEREVRTLIYLERCATELFISLFFQRLIREEWESLKQKEKAEDESKEREKREKEVMHLLIELLLV